MSDITKCTNELCPIKHTCYRWTAPTDPLWQAYQRFDFGYCGNGAICDHYIPVPVHTNHPFTDREQSPNVNE